MWLKQFLISFLKKLAQWSEYDDRQHSLPCYYIDTEHVSRQTQHTNTDHQQVSQQGELNIIFSHFTFVGSELRTCSGIIGFCKENTESNSRTKYNCPIIDPNPGIPFTSMKMKIKGEKKLWLENNLYLCTMENYCYLSQFL